MRDFFNPYYRDYKKVLKWYHKNGTLGKSGRNPFSDDYRVISKASKQFIKETEEYEPKHMMELYDPKHMR